MRMIMSNSLRQIFIGTSVTLALAGTFEKPSSIIEVIGGTAVQPEWNSMTKIIEVEVPSQGIYVWRGKAAKQPLSNNENISNYYLEGGTEQLIFDSNQNTINITSITNRITDTTW